jgi:hypothetical protein
MPNLLSLPREIRDDIYKWVLNGPFPSRTSKSSRRTRKRISKQVATSNSADNPSNPADQASDGAAPGPAIDPDVDYYDCEETVRYPLTTPLPPTEALLQANQQIRAEMLDTVSRAPLRYKIDLAFRDDTATYYPTWISVPALSHRVDVLDVDLRVRPGKTSSLCSINDDDTHEREGDVFFGGLMLLRRFLDRGVFFLSKKKTQKITIGLLALNILTQGVDIGGKEPKELIDDIGEFLDEWFRGNTFDDTPYTAERQDELLRFFAERIDRFSCRFGNASREWDVKAAIADRKPISPPQEQNDQPTHLQTLL